MTQLMPSTPLPPVCNKMITMQVSLASCALAPKTRHLYRLRLRCRENVSRRTAQRSAQRSPGRSAQVVDERRADGSAAARVEQEDDHVAGVPDLRHTVQQPADVRARQVRQVTEIGTAEERMFRRHKRAVGPVALRVHIKQQQQQQQEQ